KKLLKRIGSPKGGYWEIIKSEKNEIYNKVTFGKVADEKGGEKVGERVGEKLMGNQSKIIEVIKENPHISARELSKIIGISQRKIESNIAKLKSKKLLKRIGPAKGGHWEVIEK
ncbi:winged helix-turn-helix transcriptional regulator, partial [Candidatus Dependentiae bacterium]|nr:winged helix-turn-helix transcriptional regulator [Candidatus Dependentiae bacterium]